MGGGGGCQISLKSCNPIDIGEGLHNDLKFSRPRLCEMRLCKQGKNRLLLNHLVVEHIINKLLLFSAGAMAGRFAEQQPRCVSLGRTQSGSEQVIFVQGNLD